MKEEYCMKRVTALAAALILMLIAVYAVPVIAEEESPAGTWYLQSMKHGDIELDGGFLSSFTMVLTLNEDGTATMDSGAETIEGTWSLEGTEGSLELSNTLPFTFEDDQVIIEQEGTGMIFGKEAPAAQPAEVAPAVTDPQISDFIGTWNVSSYVMYGMPLPASLMGEKATLTIEEEQIRLHEDLLDMNNNFEPTESRDYTFSAQLQDDGTLLVDFGEESLTTPLFSGAGSLVLTLREDGKITGIVPEFIESLALFQSSLESSGEESENAEDAGESAGEEVQSEDSDSAGSSGDSASVEAGMEIYLLFEKAE